MGHLGGGDGSGPGFLGHLGAGNGSGLGSHLKLPLLSDKLQGKQDSVKNLLAEPLVSVISDGKPSDSLKQAGTTAPNTQGCSLTQTVFNGTVLYLKMTLTFLWDILDMHVSYFSFLF